MFMISLHGNSLSCLHLHFHCKTQLFCKLRLHPVCFTHMSRMTQYRSLVFPLVVGLVLRWQHSHFVFQVLNNSVFMNLVLQFLFEIKKKIIIYCKLEFFPIHFLKYYPVLQMLCVLFCFLFWLIYSGEDLLVYSCRKYLC